MGTQQNPVVSPDAVFLRKASGVVRAMSPVDGMYFGYLSAAGLYGVTLFLFLALATFPGANIPLSILISFVGFGVVFGVYAILATAMPRSGGDYVFVSRILNPALGFTIGFAGWAFWQFFYSFLAAGTIVTGSVPPLLNSIGIFTGNNFWINAGNWVQQPWPKNILTVILLVIAAWIMIKGLRWYLNIQKYFMMPASIVGLVLIMAGFLFVSHSTFLGHLDSFENSVGGLSSSGIIAQASHFGYNPNPGFSWSDTFGVSVMLDTLFLWCMWQTELLGEIKSASSTRNMFLMMFGADFLTLVTYMIGMAWTYSYVGQPLMGSFAYMIINHPDTLAGGWGFRGAATLMIIPLLNIVATVFIFLAFLAAASQSLFNTTLTASRLYLAMAFDRVLPAWLGEVNRKGAPANAIILALIVGIVLTIIYQFQPSLAQAVFAAGLVSLVAMLVTVVAGTVFPWRLRHVYQASPGGRYKVGSIPLITIAGVVGIVFLAASIVFLIFNPGFGMLTGSAVGSWIIIAILFILSPIYFYANKAYRARSGIDISHAYSAIPPD